MISHPTIFRQFVMIHLSGARLLRAGKRGPQPHQRRADPKPVLTTIPARRKVRLERRSDALLGAPAFEQFLGAVIGTAGMGLDSPAHARTVHTARLRLAGARAKRNPMLLFRLSGVLLLRFAERQLIALLFHDPPRSTRSAHPFSNSWRTPASQICLHAAANCRQTKRAQSSFVWN